MVRHQHIGMPVNPRLLAGLAKRVKLDPVISLGEKAGASLVAPLNYMDWHNGEFEPAASWPR